VGLFVPHVDAKGESKTRLSMLVTCDKDTADKAVILLKSIRFGEEAQ
jgi:hypothetical protein